MRTAFVACATFCLLLAGCTGGTDEPMDPVDQAPGSAGSPPVDLSATGCTEVMTAFLRPPDGYQALLPEGYTPADASAVLGLPVPTGLGFAGITVYECDDMAYTHGPFVAADVFIAVEDPGKANTSADLHFYTMETYAPAGPYYDLLRSAGWNVLLVDSAMASASGGPVATGTASAVNATGAGFTMAVTGAVPNTLAGLARFYHETPWGTSWMDFDTALPVFVGVSDLQATGGQLPSKLDSLLDLFDSPLEVPGIVVPTAEWRSELVPAGAHMQADGHQH